MINDLKNLFNKENRTKYFIPVLGYLFLSSALIFAIILSKELPQNKKVSVVKTNVFENVKLEARGAIVWDVVNKRELFAKNPYMPLPLASLTKVMTAVTTYGKFENDQEIKITREDLIPEGDSNLVVGDKWKAKDLRDFTLITSSNDGALALAVMAGKQCSSTTINPQEEFVREMNETGQKIGLVNSRFFNEHGLDEQTDKGGAYGSAKDMALLFEYAMKNYPEILEATRYKNLSFASTEKIYNAENTNVVINKIPGILASKTGYTDLAGGNLVVAFDAGLNRPIIISVLGSTEEGRFSDVLQLVEATLKQISPI